MYVVFAYLNRKKARLQQYHIANMSCPTAAHCLTIFQRSSFEALNKGTEKNQQTQHPQWVLK